MIRCYLSIYDDFVGLKNIANTASIVLVGVGLLGWGLSYLNETPLTLNEV